MRRLAGAVWILLWMLVLHVVSDPYRHLGGLVAERLRWLEWVVLWGGIPLGFTAGRSARDEMEQGNPGTVAGHLRLLLYPPLLLAAAFLVALQVAGDRDAVGVVVTALLSYWFGIDLALSALPLLSGQAYSFDSPQDPDVFPFPAVGRSAQDCSTKGPVRRI